MEERLVQLLQSEGINPTRFAERIGVQRSSISHILSGRNKPSFDFIIKILDSFPSVNPDWLLRGKGLMYKNDIPVQPSLFDVVKQAVKEPSGYEQNENLPIGNDDGDKTLNSSGIRSSDPLQSGNKRIEIVQDKKIEKVVIFYSDKTFSDYQPDT